MKRIISLLFAALILIISAAGCGNNTENGEASPDSAGMEVFIIETPYGNLKYPDKWQQKVDINKQEEENVYSVNFYTADGEVRLFDLNFGGGEGYFLGLIEHNGEKVSVYVDEKPLDEKAENFELLSEMQEDVNVTLDYLIKEYGVDTKASAPALTDPPVTVYEIKTALGKLYYPDRWKDKVTVKDSEKSVSFLSDDIEVFALRLGGKEGFFVGKYNGEDLRLVTAEFDKKSMSDERFAELCAMQEDSNVVLEYLEKESAFSAE